MFLEEDLSREQIHATMHGTLSKGSVATYIREALAHAKKAGLPIRPRKEMADATSFGRDHSRKPFSFDHVRLGVRINQDRHKKDMTAPAYAHAHHLGNQMSLRAMEQGLHDFTLSELQQLAAVLDVDLSTLLRPPGR